MTSEVQVIIQSPPTVIELNHQTGPRGPSGEDGAQGPQGPQGPAGPGLPIGGIAGQIIVKQSNTDFDTAYADFVFPNFDAIKTFIISGNEGDSLCTLLQAAIDEVSSGGGAELIVYGYGVIRLQEGKNYCITLPSNFSLKFASWRSGLEFDNSQSITSGVVNYIIAIGTKTEGSSYINVSGGKLVGNQSKLPSGTYILGIGADQEDITKHSDYINIYNCHIDDVNLGVNCFHNSVSGNFYDPIRVSNNFKFWNVYNNLITNTTNWAIEFSECKQSSAHHNMIWNCYGGVQTTMYGHHNSVHNNIIHSVTGAALSFGEGSYDLDIENNLVVCSNKGSGGGTGIWCYRENFESEITIKNIRIKGNRFLVDDTNNPGTRGFALITRVNNTGAKCIWDNILLEDNFFGPGLNCYFYDTTYAASSLATNWIIKNNFFTGNVFLSTVWNSGNIKFIDNTFVSNFNANGSNTYIRNNFIGTVDLKNSNFYEDNVFLIAPTWNIGLIIPRGNFYKSGDYIIGQGGTGVSFVTLSDKRLTFTKIEIFVPTIISSIGFEITATGIDTVGNCTNRLGIYRDSGGKPYALVSEANNTINGVANPGWYEAPISAVLQPGVYWLAHKTEGAPTTHATVRSHTGRAVFFPFQTPLTLSQTAFNALLISNVNAGALPETVNPNSMTAFGPIVMVKVL